MSKKISLLLLHGALGSSEQLRVLAKQLDESFDIHLLDFSGHGDTEMPSQYSIELFTEDVLQYLNTHKLNDIIIFGYSMGGYVAINAAQKSNHIAKIITYGTKFHWTAESASHEIKKLNPAKIAEKVPAFARQLEKRHAPNDWGSVVRKTAEMMVERGRSPILTREVLAIIDLPITILWGSEDNMVSEEESSKTASILPKGSFEILKECKHPIEQVSTDLLTKKILEHV